MNKKNILIALCAIIFSLNIVFSNEENKLNINKPEMKSMFNQKHYLAYKSAYWSIYGTIGISALINTFINLGVAYSVSNDINDIMQDLNKYNVKVPNIVSNVASYYPAVIFGVHFLMSGFAFIPYAGGILYGFFCYAIAISLLSVKIFFPINLLDIDNIDSGLDSQIQNKLDKEKTKIKNKVNDIDNKIFNTTSYFTVGTISIILSIAEITFGSLYSAEKYKKKYPLLGKNFIISPFGLLVRFEI